MQRREFLASAAALATAGRSTVSGRRSTASIRPIGLELYTVRGLMQADFDGTLARVAQIGYTEVEFAGYFNRTATQVREVLRRNHLKTPSAHTGADTINADWRRLCDNAAAVGHEYIVIAWTPETMRRTLDDWRRIAELYNRAAADAKAAGIGFGYHNHSYEFERMGDRIPYDVLLENTDPALVKLEMDLYWITAGGQDPLAYFQRWPGRIPMVHVKDRTADGRMTEVGAGAIDWRAIFAHRQQAGIKHYFVEHDEPADPVASITASFRYLQQLRV